MFCGSNPIENVVCSFVQAAGAANLGVKVLLWLQSQVPSPDSAPHVARQLVSDSSISQEQEETRFTIYARARVKGREDKLAVKEAGENRTYC